MARLQSSRSCYFFFQAEDGIRDWSVTGVQTCALPILRTGLKEAGWEVKRDIIRALVKHVEVGKEQVNVVFRIDPRPFDSRPERGMVHFCLGLERSTRSEERRVGKECRSRWQPSHE